MEIDESGWRRSGGIYGGPNYLASRAGVLGHAKAMAREFGPNGIRVNCVTPRLIETDITGDKLTRQIKAEMIKGIPLSRLGAAADLSNVPVYFASDLSAYVAGAVPDVNGGVLIHCASPQKYNRGPCQRRSTELTKRNLWRQT